ncbi:hypothetical protein OLN33_13635, partial [Pseudomonas aeruginosa]|nr:hypothetical protein [Pseudomonas aeruginosa]
SFAAGETVRARHLLRKSAPNFAPRYNFPRLHRHLEKLEQDPAVRFAHAIEDRLPAQSCGEFRGEVTLAEVASRLLA